jgi:serine/threonine-protein kinase
MQVRAAGHKTAVALPAAAGDGRFHAWPHFLPDGSGLLADRTNDGPPSIGVMSWKTKEWHVLTRGSQAQYLSPGYLVYHAPQEQEGQIDAVGFDLNSLSLRGTPVRVLSSVFRAANQGAAEYSLAQNGTLIFAPGGFARGLVQVDRQGRRTTLLKERRGYRFPKFSPDGKRIAVTIDPRPSQIWVFDLDRGSGVALGAGIAPVWFADGQRVAYSATRAIDVRAADAGRPAERLIGNDRPDVLNLNPTSVSADGRIVIYQQQAPGTDYDIWVWRPGEPSRLLLGSPARELGARLSPDGRWLAYYSTESGRHEVYVRPFPNVDEHRWQVSIDGGWTPIWAPSGRELFFMNGTALMSASVETKGTAFAAGRPEMLFSGPFDVTQDMNFDVAPDGAHFVMVEADPDAQPSRINVVFNWGRELQRALRK